MACVVFKDTPPFKVVVNSKPMTDSVPKLVTNTAGAAVDKHVELPKLPTPLTVKSFATTGTKAELVNRLSRTVSKHACMRVVWPAVKAFLHSCGV